jgi:adenosylhomocysteine nucleosidase
VKHLLVLTAVEPEARALARHLGLVAVSGSIFPHYRAGGIEVAAVGLRAALLAERMRGCPPPSLVISAGVCGALAPVLTQGDLVIPEAVLDTRGTRWVTADIAGLTRRGTLFSTEAIAGDAATKSRLWLDTGALAVDMESAAILAWAGALGVPAAVVRGVSDTATEAVPSDLVALIGQDGRIRPLLVVHAALARPSAVADAFVLGRALQAALASVAAALGRLAHAPSGIPATEPSSARPPQAGSETSARDIDRHRWGVSGRSGGRSPRQ